MPTCRELTERSSDFLDGQMTAWERLRFRAHLVRCRDCRAYVGQMRATLRALRRLPHEPAPAPVRDELLARFRQGVPRPPGRPSPARRALGMLAALDRAMGEARGFGAAILVLIGLLASMLSPGMHAGPIGSGVSCLSIEIASGLLPFLAIGYLATSERCRLEPAVYTAAAAAGSALGFFALERICEVPDVVQHVLVFHVGGFLMAVLAATIAPRLARRRSRVRASG